jgi:hypothetical protein
MWISDPEAGLPQELLLSWKTPQEFDEVCVTFDNLTRLRHDQPWECGQRVLPILVESYELAAWHHDGEWQTLAVVSGNYHRFRQHRFAPVKTDKLRLRVLATHGGTAASARVYEVQVYNGRS